MSLRSNLVHDVTIEIAPVIDDNGDDVLDWDNAAAHPEKAWVELRTTTEMVGDRAAVVSDWFAVLDHTTCAVRRARLRHGALVFSIDGEPAPCPTPRGPHHVEVRLRKVDG